MPSVNGVGSYTDASATSAVPDSTYNPATTVATGDVVDQTPPTGTSPVASLASGIGGVLLFPGRVIVQQFTTDPMDMSHLPVTILLSLGAWYGLYWYLSKPGGLLHMKHRGNE